MTEQIEPTGVTDATDRYEELMGRYALLKAEWTLDVQRARSRGVTHEDLWTYGAVLSAKGTLRIVARDNLAHPLYELAVAPGETEVTRTEYRESTGG